MILGKSELLLDFGLIFVLLHHSIRYIQTGYNKGGGELNLMTVFLAENITQNLHARKCWNFTCSLLKGFNCYGTLSARPLCCPYFSCK